MINRAALIADRNVDSNEGFALNTNYMRLQVLGGSKTRKYGQVKAIGDGKEQIPLQVRPAIESDDYLDIIYKMYIVYNVTYGGLRQHGRMDNITEA